MDTSGVLIEIFGEYPSLTYKLGPQVKSLTLSEHLHELTQWLKVKVNGQNEPEGEKDQEQAGRLGPAKTVFDKDPGNALVSISPDRLTVQSQSPFSTVKANCCVFQDKWMYEVQLRSKGVMQIGWCSAKCKFTTDTGVGDTKYSYGLDGSKQRIWHVYTKKYGPYWRSGDVFSVCLDMDGGKIEYYRNGVSLGEAFSDIERGPGLALFPAVSLSYNDSLTANFGGSPFRHPIPGYKPLQLPPKLLLQQADYLLQYLANLSRLISRSKKPQDQEKNSTDSVFMVVAAILVEELAPLLTNSYVVEDKLFSYVRSMCVIRSDPSQNNVIHPGLRDSTLGTFLTLLWTYMEPDEIKGVIMKLINLIGSSYKETPIDLEYEKQRMVIVVLTCICNHPMTRKYLLLERFFEKNCLPLFLYIKPPDEAALERLLPDDHIWTEGIGGRKDLYLAACEKLNSCTTTLYSLQRNLIAVLLNHSDGSLDSPSSRRIFLTKFRNYVMENSLEHRSLSMQNTYATPTQPAVALSFLCILLDVTRQLLAVEVPQKRTQVDPVNFYNDAFTYFHFDRLGGVLSHLKKVFRTEMIGALGESHPAIVPLAQEPSARQDSADFYSAMLMITQHQPNQNFPSSIPRNIFPVRQVGSPVRRGIDRNTNQSLDELLDCSIFYYYAVAHKYIVMIADLRDNIAMLSGILSETKDCSDEVLKTLEELKDANGGLSNTHDDILLEIQERFGQRKSIFAKRSMELARKQAWYRSVALGAHRRDLLCWLLKLIFDTLQTASSQGVLFSFVPETYINVLPILLDTVLDFSFHDMNLQHDLSDSMSIVMSAAEFLAAHSTDPRVVLASCKDALLQALGTVTCHEVGIRALEKTSASSQLAMVHSLLRPYENRAWGQSNWLLLRFWLGEGFAYRESRPTSIWQQGELTSSALGLYRSRGKNGSHTGLLHHIAPACPSRHFQSLISRILLADEPYCTIFLNSLLSQLNWAFSEFILLLQEIQTANRRTDQHQGIDSRQLKICSMCFELTVSLMRALEMIITIAPGIFQDPTRPNSDLLLGRVCQLASQVLSRVTTPPGCFQYVLDLCLPDLSSVTHFAIISAVLGILLALMKDEVEEEDFVVSKIPRVSRCLLIEPSFQSITLEFALGDVKVPPVIPPPTQAVQTDNGVDSSAQSPEPFHQDPPILSFNLADYPTHITAEEILKVKQMIRVLQKRQTMMSEVTILSEDSLCSICYAKAISCEFLPCQHQSCGNCIVQHLLSNKLCFYCKTPISCVKSFDGTILYENTLISLSSDDSTEYFPS
ncbi:E3 ubiquitin-protein ligase RNF123 [Phlebotomus papatasi]|uniref:E3 ubiquitin-protein ligase RNF123 n=1 Tax=Phlebotomus papatasi TaxID=29031 RepID=UPI002483D8E4|nr:E3 ubiquitin-protein ligase RNF123 [Phlebotomus papatasi]